MLVSQCAVIINTFSKEKLFGLSLVCPLIGRFGVSFSGTCSPPAELPLSPIMNPKLLIMLWLWCVNVDEQSQSRNIFV